MQRQVLILVFGLTLLGTNPVAIAERPLDALPSQTLIVTRWKTPRTTIDRVADVAAGILPQLGPHFRQAREDVGLAIDNPRLAGVAEHADWWIAWVLSGNEMVPIFAIPTTDSTAAREAVTGSFHFVDDRAWLFYSPDHWAASLVEDCIAGRIDPISGVLDNESHRMLDHGDVGVYFNLQPIRRIYHRQLSMRARQVEVLPNQFQRIPFPDAEESLKPLLKRYAALVGSGWQAFEDTESVSATATLGESHVDGEVYVRVQPDSATAHFMRANPPGDLQLVERLPTERLVYVAVSVDWKPAVFWSAVAAADLFQSNDSVRQKLRSWSDQYATLKSGVYATALELGSLQDGVLRAYELTEVKPSKTAQRLSREAIELLSGKPVPGVEQQVEFAPDADSYGDVVADRLTIVQKYDERLDPFGFQNKLLRYLHGPEGMQQRTAYLPDLVVRTMGSDRKAMQVALEAAKTQPAADTSTAVGEARRQLGAKANLIVLADIPNLLREITRLMLESNEVPVPPALLDLKLPKTEPSYLGLSLASEEGGARLRLHVPIAQFQGIAQLAASSFLARDAAIEKAAEESNEDRLEN